MVKCPKCGSENIIADKVTLVLMDMPFELSEDDGPQYDDTDAKYTDGWDFTQEDKCHCGDCKAKLFIVTDDDGKFSLAEEPNA